MMLQIDIMSRTPVYEQISSQIEKLITTGILKEGDQLPSVRTLSVDLSVNPNTIQKAYGELDMRGIIGSVPGKGCFVMPGACEKLRMIAKDRLYELKNLAAELMTAGVTKEEIINSISSITSEKEDKK